jgi:hypothetical protein
MAEKGEAGKGTRRPISVFTGEKVFPETRELRI